MVAAIAAAMATSERISRDESLIVPAIPMIVAMAPGPKDERHGEGHESDIAACFAEEARAIELPRGSRIIWRSPQVRSEGDRVHLDPWTGISWRLAA